MTKILTVDKILDNWAKTKSPLAASKGVSDKNVWCLARMAAVIAGKRAQDIGNEEYEDACAAFIEAMDGFIVRTKIN